MKTDESSEAIKERSGLRAYTFARLVKRFSKFTYLIAVVLIMATVLVLYLPHKSEQTSPQASHATSTISHSAYAYKTLTASSVQGSTTSLQFQRPKEFNLQQKDSTVQKSRYVHTGADNQGELAVLGAVTAYATHLLIADNPSIDTQSAARAFNDPNSSDYQNYSKSMGINSFILDEIGGRFFSGGQSSKLKTSIKHPKVFKSPNIASNVWSFDFSVADSSSNKSVQGTLLFALGKSTNVYYGLNYFLVSSLSYNWQPNQQTWQEVLNSLKIVEK